MILYAFDRGLKGVWGGWSESEEWVGGGMGGWRDGWAEGWVDGWVKGLVTLI